MTRKPKHVSRNDLAVRNNRERGPNLHLLFHGTSDLRKGRVAETLKDRPGGHNYHPMVTAK
jgi:hypothetical protein